MPRDNQPPAFMFYVDDFCSDDKVEAMPTEAVGCYILLICKAWRTRPPATLPDDDALLARWSRVSDSRWLELKRHVLAPWVLCNDGRWLQKRLRKEYEKQRARAAALSTSGKKGAAKRWQAYGDAIGEANGDAIATENENGNGIESDSSDSKNPKKPRARFVPPSVEEVQAYCETRRNAVDAEKFVNFYGSKGWMVGRNKMTDWKKAVITWEKNTQDSSRQGKRAKLPDI